MPLLVVSGFYVFPKCGKITLSQKSEDVSLNEERQRFNPSHTEGLNQEQVLLRQQQGLVNKTQDRITKTNGQIIRGNVFTLFNGFNFAIGVCLALVGAYTNMLYLMVIITNIFTRTIQEMRSRNMVQNLSLISAIKVTVVRDGNEFELPVEEMVLDDITVLDMGKQICSDSVVVHGEIEVNESLLTGEADPVVKLPGDTLLSGSFVISGKCYAKVENVGAENFSTKLVQEAKKHKQATSALLNSMRKITKFTGYFITPLGIILFLEAYFMRSMPLNNAVTSTAAAMLGMLPKGLVLLITFTLIISLIRLSKKKILVQELHSVETLAYVDVLCLDKTGTITEGKMSVLDVFPINESIMSVPIDKAISCYIGAADDNNATFLALKEHFQADRSAEIISKIPFSSERKWGCISTRNMGTLVLGAPEKLLPNSDAQLPLDVKEAQKSGNRILCLGYSPDPVIEGILPSITLVSAIALNDPVRKNAKETLDFFKREGVAVKIISGDNPLTVSSVAKQAGLEDYENFIDMSQIDNDDDLNEAAAKYSIFGRVSPSQKRQLIKAYKAKKHTVAMTGDGVNDVLALKESDCSIAMATGSDASRQVAQLVLLNSDFSSLTNVVMEGRRVINNITRFGSVYIIKTIFSFLLGILGMLTLTAFPFVPIQITLYDMILEGYFSFPLTFERNMGRVHGNFLTNIFRTAMPFSILVVINIFAIQALSPALGLSAAESTTVMFYMLGMIGIFASIKLCRPFNLLRVFVCITTAIGFYLGSYLFADILYLERLTTHPLLVFAGFAVASVPLVLLAIFIVNKVFRKYTKHST